MSEPKTLLQHARQAATVFFYAAVITVVITFVFKGQADEQRRTAADTLHGVLATACVLSLPVNPDTGRDPKAVTLCFTQYGLQPPALHNP